ncbi:hypothetical protein BDFB_011948 [Asbolus verrucosus]|uniref:Uncharacterized protein n=1 Tax=Asbolus verrucosus TaxID=1661398 RepID=A0A482VAT9_ASBVE|nr:hypothetical protein BDFB_011948 [Asbolus verrucosus]
MGKINFSSGEPFLHKKGRYLDKMTIGCSQSNKDMYRTDFEGWCQQYEIIFKLNTVVHLQQKRKHVRKVFQCLLLEDENGGPKALTNAEEFYIDDVIFERFLKRYEDVKCLIPESNTKIGSKILFKSILDIGVENVLKFSVLMK